MACSDYPHSEGTAKPLADYAASGRFALRPDDAPGLFGGEPRFCCTATPEKESAVSTAPGPRFNHAALSVPAALIDADGRRDLLRFHEQVFGWSEMPTLTRDRELLMLRCWSNEEFVYLHASDAPMRTGPSEPLDFSVTTRAKLDAIHERAEKFRAGDARVELEDVKVDDFRVLKLAAFYVRYRLPLRIEVQHFGWAPGLDAQRVR
jgi:hypothetical protein